MRLLKQILALALAPVLALFAWILTTSALPNISIFHDSSVQASFSPPPNNWGLLVSFLLTLAALVLPIVYAFKK